MSAHALLNLLNELRKRSNVRLCRAFNGFSQQVENKFNNIGAQMLDYLFII